MRDGKKTILCTNAIYYLQNSFCDMKHYANRVCSEANAIIIVRNEFTQVIDLQASTCSYGSDAVFVQNYVSSRPVKLDDNELLSKSNLLDESNYDDTKTVVFQNNTDTNNTDDVFAVFAKIKFDKNYRQHIIDTGKKLDPFACFKKL